MIVAACGRRSKSPSDDRNVHLLGGVAGSPMGVSLQGEQAEKLQGERAEKCRPTSGGASSPALVTASGRHPHLGLLALASRAARAAVVGCQRDERELA
jgi:hypothetical protein